MRRAQFIIVAVLLLAGFGLLLIGCQDKSAEPTTPKPPPDGGGAALYGTGSMDFATSVGDTFFVNGPYKPSALFASDTSGEGAGGFLHDTLFASRHLKAQLTSYKHSISNGLLNDQVFVISLYDSTPGLYIGGYRFVRPDSTVRGRYAIATYIDFSDSLGIYNVYQSKSGLFSVAGYNSLTNRMTGIFTGTLRGVPPDTTNLLQIVQGQYNIEVVGTFFDY